MKLLCTHWKSVQLDEKKIAAVLLNRIKQCVELAEDLSIVFSASVSAFSAQFAYRTIDKRVELRTKSITLGEVKMYCGEKNIQLLEGSTQIAVIVCTIGEAISELYNHYINEEDYIKAYLCDMIANAATNETMETAKRCLKAEIASNGLSITSHIGPGYCEWDIREQEKLLSLLPAHICGITLTPSSLMLPVKSLCGIVGIGERVTYRRNACVICNLLHCAYKM